MEGWVAGKILQVQNIYARGLTTGEISEQIEIS